MVIFAPEEGDEKTRGIGFPFDRPAVLAAAQDASEELCHVHEYEHEHEAQRAQLLGCTAKGPGIVLALRKANDTATSGSSGSKGGGASLLSNRAQSMPSKKG